jgi:hypothetical protein
MKYAIPIAVALGIAPGLAFAQTATTPDPATDAAKAEVTELDTGKVTIVYDKALSEEFAVSRDIVDRVKAEFGEHAVYDNGQDLPQGMDGSIAPGAMLPESVEVGEVPEQLGDLPTLAEGSHWVTVGEHLVEVTPDNTVVMVVYDALP